MSFSPRALGALATASALSLALVGPWASTARADTTTFSTPGTYSWTVPAGVTTITFEVAGGGGGGGRGTATGGHGAIVSSTLSVAPGQVLSLVVGGGGGHGGGGGGGGASSLDDSAGALVVAGGGGGGGGQGQTSGTGAGGDGGTPSGAAGSTIVNSDGRTSQGGAGGSSGFGGAGGTGFGNGCVVGDGLGLAGGSGNGGAGGTSGGGGAPGFGAGTGTGGNSPAGRWTGAGGGGYGGGGGGGGGCASGGGDGGGGGGGSTGPVGVSYSLAGNGGVAGAAGGSGWVIITTPVLPPPQPPVPASTPLDVVATAGDRSALVTWQPPASAGSFPVTNYLATSSPGGRLCLASAATLTCEVKGLSNGTAYTFTVRALTGAGWSAASSPSAEVIPVAPDRASISITGAREGKRLVVSGSTVGIGTGALLTAWTSKADAEWMAGRSVPMSIGGDFTWSRLGGTGPWRVYFTTGDARSNTVTMP